MRVLALEPEDIEVHFPSFSEGLSLRVRRACGHASLACGFPFLFGGTFIEGI